MSQATRVGEVRGILDLHSPQNECSLFIHAGSFRHFLAEIPPPSRREAYRYRVFAPFAKNMKVDKFI